MILYDINNFAYIVAFTCKCIIFSKSMIESNKQINDL